jgi:hypothetical protein
VLRITSPGEQDQFVVPYPVTGNLNAIHSNFDAAYDVMAKNGGAATMFVSGMCMCVCVFVRVGLL